jgi:hypothetical protein
MISAAGFDAGKNVSKNNVAGRSQKSIAALSIGLFLSWGRNAVQDARNFRRALSGSIRGRVHGPNSRAASFVDYLTILYFFAGLSRNVRTVSPGYSACMNAQYHGVAVTLGNRATPVSQRATLASCSCSCFGKPAMKSPASRSVRSSPPPGRNGSSKARCQPLSLIRAVGAFQI